MNNHLISSVVQHLKSQRIAFEFGVTMLNYEMPQIITVVHQRRPLLPRPRTSLGCPSMIPPCHHVSCPFATEEGHDQFGLLVKHLLVADRPSGTTNLNRGVIGRFAPT
jgi:hypothetical protein